MKKIVEHPGLTGSKATVHLTEQDAPYREGNSTWSSALCGDHVRVPIVVKLSAVTCTRCIRKAYGK